MPVSEVSICNLSLSWLGGNLITSFQDDTTEAKLCNANYNFSRDAVIEERDWTFASERNKPNKLADMPAFGYTAAFQLPIDYVRMTHVSDSPYFDLVIQDWIKEGNRILCHHDVIYIKYIKQVVDPTMFSPGFVQALAARIAADICVPLTNNVDLFDSYWQLYLNKLETAGAYDGLQSRRELLRSRRLVRIR